MVVEGGEVPPEVAFLVIGRSADADRNLEITTEEWDAFLAKVGADDQGVIAKEALAKLAFGPEVPGAEELLPMLLDRDGDEKVEIEDLKAIFAAVDANHDGKVSGEEMAPPGAWASRALRRPADPPGPSCTPPSGRPVASGGGGRLAEPRRTGPGSRVETGARTRSVRGTIRSTVPRSLSANGIRASDPSAVWAKVAEVHASVVAGVAPPPEDSRSASSALRSVASARPRPRGSDRVGRVDARPASGVEPPP